MNRQNNYKEEIEGWFRRDPDNKSLFACQRDGAERFRDEIHYPLVCKLENEIYELKKLLESVRSYNDSPSVAMAKNRLHSQIEYVLKQE
jgi:hypothetical protein